MKVEQKQVGTVDIVKPAGPLTEEDSANMVEALYSRLASANPRLVMDLSAVPYLDSHGLEVLLDVARELRQRGLSCKLAMVTGTCREILDLTEMLGEFEVFDEIEDAVRSFV